MPAITRSMVNKTNIVHIIDVDNNIRINRQNHRRQRHHNSLLKNILVYSLIAFIVVYLGILTYISYMLLPENIKDYFRMSSISIYAFKTEIATLGRFILLNYENITVGMLLLILYFML